MSMQCSLETNEKNIVLLLQLYFWSKEMSSFYNKVYVYTKYDIIL